MGITLAEARERLGEAKRMVADGKLPAREKTRDKARVKGAGVEEANNAIYCVAPVGEGRVRRSGDAQYSALRWLIGEGKCH